MLTSAPVVDSSASLLILLLRTSFLNACSVRNMRETVETAVYKFSLVGGRDLDVPLF